MTVRLGQTDLKLPDTLDADSQDIDNCGNIILDNGKSIQTDSAGGSIVKLKAYDSDASSYSTFANLVAGTTPSLSFSQPSGSELSWEGGKIGNITPLEVLQTSSFYDAGSGIAFGSAIAVSGSMNTDIDFLFNTNKGKIDASSGFIKVGSGDPVSPIDIEVPFGVQQLKIKSTDTGVGVTEIYFDRTTNSSADKAAVGYADDRGAYFWVNGLDRFNIDTSGDAEFYRDVTANGKIRMADYSDNTPIVVTSSTHSVAANEKYFIVNPSSGNVTFTLPSASTYAGRELFFRNYTAAATAYSASSNVIRLGGTSTGTIIMNTGTSNHVHLVSDGTNWIQFGGN